jgi:hypothetical protein
MASQWYYTQQGKRQGPIPTQQLKELAATGQLLPTDLVGKDGMAALVPASRIKGLFAPPVNDEPPPIPSDVQPPPLPTADEPPPLPKTFLAHRGMKSPSILPLALAAVIVVALVGVGAYIYSCVGNKHVATSDIEPPRGHVNDAHEPEEKNATHKAESARVEKSETAATVVAVRSANEVVIGKRVPGIVSDSIVESPNSGRVAFIVKRANDQGEGAAARRGMKQLVVVNGDEGKEYNAVSKPIFSPDSERVAYQATRYPSQFIVVDGEEGKEYSAVKNVVFSPNSKRVAYQAARRPSQFIVVDGEEGKEYINVSGPVFSADSRRVAYKACVSDGKYNPEISVVDGVEGKPHRSVVSPTFSPDSKRVAYAMGDSYSCIVVDGEVGKRYMGVGGYVFTPDSTQVVYWAEYYSANRGNRSCIVMGDQKEKGYQFGGLGPPILSNDGKRLAYSATRRAKRFIVVDREEGKEYDAVTNPIFSPDSRRVAYMARRDKTQFIVLDRVEGKEYDSVCGLSFSPDSRRVAYKVKRNGKWCVVVNGTEGQEYDEFVSVNWVLWETDKLLHVAALRGDEFRSVTMEIKEGE